MGRANAELCTWALPMGDQPLPGDRELEQGRALLGEHSHSGLGRCECLKQVRAEFYELPTDAPSGILLGVSRSGAGSRQLLTGRFAGRTRHCPERAVRSRVEVASSPFVCTHPTGTLHGHRAVLPPVDCTSLQVAGKVASLEEGLASSSGQTSATECVVARVSTMTAAPFTLQRLCEILADPLRHYRSRLKLLRALTRLLTVSTTVPPVAVEARWSSGCEEEVEEEVEFNAAAASSSPGEDTLGGQALKRPRSGDAWDSESLPKRLKPPGGD
jgi:hypothetical protein